MTSLWNIEPDNLKACRAENRRIFPEVKDFFQEAAEQLEPGSGVEQEYLLVLKPNYQWCALRLLARRSTLFFQPNSQFKTVPDFLKGLWFSAEDSFFPVLFVLIENLYNKITAKMH